MAIEGYWGWGWDAGVEGATLRRRTGTQRDVGLKAPADVKITNSSPVLAGQPPHHARTGTFLRIADVLTDDAGSAPDSSFDLSLDISFTSDTSHSAAAPQRRADADPDSSFSDISPDASLDISLISDTSSSSDGDGDGSFGSFHFHLTLPPPLASHLPPSNSPPTSLAPGAALKPTGLGITNLFSPSGTAFDGRGVLSFGVPRRALARVPRGIGSDVGSRRGA
ncbi:hypothetical protein C8R47DRAFT_112276 [Mycena vitilis]|nr:hypothetical protein C8R47DRAFT_112276 [Mycena vitilis]